MAAKGKKKNKTPTIGAPFDSKKEPRVPSVPEGLISWRFGYMDLGGRWSMKQLDATQVLEAREALLTFEQRTWMDSTGKGSKGTQHPCAVPTLCPDAQKRLKQIGRGDFGHLWGFRLSSSERLWGFRIGDVCYILWWDPDHSVCPSEK